MSAPYGRTYRIQIDVIAEEHVTVLPTGNLILEDAVDGNYTLVERHRLDEYAQSQPPYTAHIADCIHRELISDTHDACGWEWTQQPVRGWWYRSGKCPTCGEW